LATGYCPNSSIHVGIGIVAAIVNATIGALILLLIMRLVPGGGAGKGARSGMRSGPGRATVSGRLNFEDESILPRIFLSKRIICVGFIGCTFWLA
jgi:hypothetical protein